MKGNACGKKILIEKYYIFYHDLFVRDSCNTLSFEY